VGGIPEILGHDELLFDPGNPSSLAERLTALYDDPQRYRHARRLCSERRRRFEFDWVGRFETELQNIT
jgi:glycosyltransferase involved in cell wall biosynthesis